MPVRTSRDISMSKQSTTPKENFIALREGRWPENYMIRLFKAFIHHHPKLIAY